VVVQDVVDRLDVVFPCAPQHDVTIRARVGVQQELGHDLVGAAEIEESDSGEVEQCGCRRGLQHRVLNPAPDRGPGRAGDEVRVRRHDRFAEDPPELNGLDHRVLGSWAGMTTCS
jgi:hypothetical protein